MFHFPDLSYDFIVFAASAAGLTINVAKCRLGPSTLAKYLGIIVDGARRLFSLPASRAERLRVQLVEMSASVERSQWVPARAVAQMVGLLWAMAPCCPRAVSVMARGATAILARAMGAAIYGKHKSAEVEVGTNSRRITLKAMMAAFWDGYVRWSHDADEELRFWLSVPLNELRAPISADTLEVLASNMMLDTSAFKRGGMTFMASDASETAGGGGMLHRRRDGFDFIPGAEFFAPLPRNNNNNT